MKTYYKVVRSDLKSVQTFSWETDYFRKFSLKDFIIQYKIGEFVKPKIEGSDLMVFSNLKDAIGFAHYYTDAKIYKCNIVGGKSVGIFSPYLSGLEDIYCNIYEKKKAKKRWSHLVSLRNIPNGTVFCSAVKLIERVNY